MNKKKILYISLGAVILAAVGAVVIIGGPGQFFQGALYNIRPIYRECHIVGKNFESDKVKNCEQFTELLAKKSSSGGYELPDGEYVIDAKYTDKKLGINRIPIKISNRQLQCTFIENNYKPLIYTSSPKDLSLTQEIKDPTEVPVGYDGLIVQINYQKDGQTYFYDTNICENSFKATLDDLGTAKLDFNGFINSRALVNEVLINRKPSFINKQNKVQNDLYPGNVFATLNAAPDIKFKFTIPCSTLIPKVEMPTIETTKNPTITFKGLDKKYLDACGSRLYLGLQNSNRYDDIQLIQNLGLVSQNGVASYTLDLSQVTTVNAKETVFPYTMITSLFLRDRSDSDEAFTLGTGVLTVTSYKPPKKPKVSTTDNNYYDNIPESKLTIEETNSAILDSESAPETTDTDIAQELPTQAEEVIVPQEKVRRMPEAILINPAIPGQTEENSNNSLENNLPVTTDSTETATPAQSPAVIG